MSRCLLSHRNFEISKVNNNGFCLAKLYFKFEGLRVSRDQEFDISRVNLLCYNVHVYRGKIGTGDSLRAIKKIERSKFEPFRVTWIWKNIQGETADGTLSFMISAYKEKWHLFWRKGMVEKDLVSTIIFNPLLKFCSVFITVKKTKS